MIIIGSFLLIIIFTEFIFQEINIFISYGQFFYILFLSFIKQFFRAIIDQDEKYLFEYDSMNPFYVLLLEGLFGFFLSLIYDSFYNPFKKIKDFKRNKTSSEFVILNLCLIIYAILSALRNLFRVNTKKIFTPMTTASIVYISNPVYFIRDFCLNKDVITSGERNYGYFFINLIIGIIISFFSLVFNEFVILFFCNLDRDSYLDISIRAISEEKFIETGSISSRSSSSIKSSSSRYNSNDEDSLIYHFKF